MCIFSKLDTLCFNQTSPYSVIENAGYAELPLMLSTTLQKDIMVKFRYFEPTNRKSATGEQL